MARSGRIALAQVNTTVGDFAGNAARVRAAAEVAREAGAALAVFPELTVCGYPPRDLLDLPDFLERARQALEELARPAAWSKGIALVVGFPEAPDGAPPPGVYNAAALISDGRVVAVGRKSLLPTYDVFDETRYFLPAGASTTAAAPEGLGVPLGLSVCEDIWNDQRFWERPRYARDPIADLVRAGAGLVVNVSASPYAMGKAPLRERMLSASARDHGAPIAYVNQVGGNDALLFDGGSMLLARDGAVLARAPLFEEAVLVCDLEGGAPLALGLDGRPLPPPPPPPADAQADEVLRALVMGVRDYVRKCGFRQAVVGLSGGIDSALTACIAAEALGAENVLGVAMPSRYSSGHSREDAAELARNLGVRFREIGIEPMHAAFLAALAADGAPPLCDLADQNVQARVRGQILMAISNDTGALVLTTGNKSEIAVGYCTLYGDMAGGLAAIGDVPKTLVYRVARAANARAGRTLVPERTFTKPPSAELKPGQLDQDSLPPYDVLDDILQAYVEERRPLEAIVARGHDEAIVRRVLRMVVQSEYKRRQAAPVLKVSEKAFGEGRRFPIAQGYRY
ncbi:NAD+ synthetase [Anaeromyxobacter dehalogenans 2CP-1]|uniref:Glutamine-dependent NAD(+) synthetase n=1 Tax=Anaeromyxobacter dehalogenans (strain ATCC BAA-258 / DSM 21875 / 2CP-1) TaxID=455488 RepID=B8J9W3_ANAD2|nr:NAD+ synthase [Anaeromyxobacter dehalogenans]ACL63666.1 NAD+ synthetase [Anaeromyxobacter dehalogenans 2CP-1]